MPATPLPDPILSKLLQRERYCDTLLLRISEKTADADRERICAKRYGLPQIYNGSLRVAATGATREDGIVAMRESAR